jgi:hypothetical protein
MVLFGALSPLFLLVQSAIAQPDAATRSIFPPAPAPAPRPLTIAELQTLTGGPTLLTFTGRDVATNDVIKLFLAVSNLSAEKTFVINSKDTPKTISVDWKDVPFWTAAQEVEKLTTLRWNTRLNSGLGLLPPSFGNLGSLRGRLGAETPLVKIVVSSISRFSNTTRSLETEAEEPLPVTTLQSAQLLMSVYFDPKLKIDSGSIQGLKIQTEEGVVNEGQRELGLDNMGRSNNLIAQINLPLPTAVRSGTTLTRVSGTLRTILSLASQTWKVSDLTAALPDKQIAGPVEYQFEGAAVEGNQLKIQMSALVVQNPAALPNTNKTFSGFSVRDAQGREVSSGGEMSTGIERVLNGHVKLRGAFSYPLKNRQGEVLEGPFSLEWPLSTETRVLDVPFELRDILVP